MGNVVLKTVKGISVKPVQKLWPGVAVLLIVLTLTPAGAGAAKISAPDYPTDFLTTNSSRILGKINQVRAKRGIPRLQFSAPLTKALTGSVDWTRTSNEYDNLDWDAFAENCQAQLLSTACDNFGSDGNAFEPYTERDASDERNYVDSVASLFVKSARKYGSDLLKPEYNAVAFASAYNREFKDRGLNFFPYRWLAVPANCPTGNSNPCDLDGNFGNASLEGVKPFADYTRPAAPRMVSPGLKPVRFGKAKKPYLYRNYHFYAKLRVNPKAILLWSDVWIALKNKKGEFWTTSSEDPRRTKDGKFLIYDFRVDKFYRNQHLTRVKAVRFSFHGRWQWKDQAWPPGTDDLYKWIRNLERK